MASSGKQLQELVRRIEVELAAGCEIRSPDHLPDRSTGRLREVDVSIRSEVGSQPLLIIEECRDHRRKVGPDYVEQIATKRDDVRASKAVIVSTAGFTKGARTKAEHHGIGLMTMKEALAEEWASWLAFTTLELRKLSFTIHHAILTPADTPNIQNLEELEQPAQVDLNDTIFFTTEGIEWGSLNSLMLTVSRQNSELYSDVLPGGERRAKVVPIEFAEHLIARRNNAEVLIKGAIVWCEVWIEVDNVPISRWEYAKVDEAPVAQYADASFQLPGIVGKDQQTEARVYLVRTAEGIQVRMETGDG